MSQRFAGRRLLQRRVLTATLSAAMLAGVGTALAQDKSQDKI